jgi:hypothetical protein
MNFVVKRILEVHSWLQSGISKDLTGRFCSEAWIKLAMDLKYVQFIVHC